MKRLLSLILAMVLTLSMVTTALAAETDVVSGTCGNDATWTFENGTLTICGTGAIQFDEEPWADVWKQIEAIVIEEGITSIYRCSFLSLTNLKSVSLPQSLTAIGSQAFQGCDQLTQITIPKNVTYIGDVQGAPASVFSGDTMTNIYVEEGNERYYSVDGVLFDRMSNALVCYPMGRTADSYTVPNGIREIAYGALWFFRGQNLVLPDGLVTICDSAFYGSEFTTLELPGTVKTIGSMAFTNCDRLTSITLPESVERVDASGFASCEALETITVLNPACHLAASGDTLSSNSVIRGYPNSTAQKYAQQYGRDFVDAETEQRYNYDSGNAAFLALLPTDVGGTGPSFNIFGFADDAGVTTGYQPFIAIEPDKTNPTYQEMLTFVRDLTKDCASDYERAGVIAQWVNDNMTYVFGMMGGGTTAEGVYHIWRNHQGNCMGYTQLNNFLLYLVDIPTATVTSYGHCWTAALINGKWIMIDSTNDVFDAPPDCFEDIENIIFAVDDNLVCVINDLTGVKLASYGISIYDHALVSEITIPSYITYIYKSVFFLEDCYETVTTHLTIHGTAGSYAETYLKNNLPHYNDYTYENGMFTAKVGEAQQVYTEDDAINLLRHVLFPEIYTIEGDMDFTGDGKLSEDDAIYLLRHVLFPELYPL